MFQQQLQKKYLDPFTVISGVVCTVIGVGIFYKNAAVFAIADNNWRIVIAAWLLVSFICICTSFSYSKIAIANPTNLGFCGWAAPLLNQKFSNFFSQLFIFFKLGIGIPVYCFYAASTFLKIFQNDEKWLSDGGGKYSTFGLVTYIGLAILVSVILFNRFKPDMAIKVQKIFFYCKLAPIFIAVVFGVIISIVNSRTGLLASKPTSMNSITGEMPQLKTAPGEFSIWKVLAAAPGIMLSFDAFLNAGFFSKRLENPKKSLPRIYMVTIAIFITLYMVITVNQLLNGTGSMHLIFSPANLGGSQVASKCIRGIFLGFIFLSALGLINGYANTSHDVISQAFDDDVFYVKRYFLRKFSSQRNAVFSFYVVIIVFWTAIIVIFSAITNSDSVYDGLTNIPILAIFCMYGLLAAAYAYRRWKSFDFAKASKDEKREFGLVILTSLIAVLGWTLIACYQFIDLCIYRVIFKFNCEFKEWKGPWDTSGSKILNWQASMVMFLSLGSIFLVYFLDWIYKRKDMKLNF